METLKRVGAACVMGLVWLWLTASGATAYPDSDRPVTVDDVFRAWEARGREVRTARIEYTLRHFMAKGSDMGKGVGNSPGPFPPKDHTAESKLTILLDADSWRYDRIGTLWCSEGEAFLPQHYVAVFDGDAYRLFFGLEADPDVVHSVGFIDGKSHGATEVKLPLVAPVINAFRATHPVIGTFRREEWRLTPTDAVIDGRRCLMLEKIPAPNSTHFSHYWIDPERDYSIVRMTRGKGSQTFTQMEVKYRHDAGVRWVPSGWNISTIVDGWLTLTDGKTATDVKYEINREIPKTAFKFDFPPGAEVYDRRTKPKVSYIVQANGAQRVITAEERNRGASYAELLTTASGTAGIHRPSSSGSGRIVVVVLTTLVILAALAAFWRTRRAS